jgi:hypothetical protein
MRLQQFEFEVSLITTSQLRWDVVKNLEHYSNYIEFFESVHIRDTKILKFFVRKSVFLPSIQYFSSADIWLNYLSALWFTYLGIFERQAGTAAGRVLDPSHYVNQIALQYLASFQRYLSKSQLVSVCIDHRRTGRAGGGWIQTRE